MKAILIVIGIVLAIIALYAYVNHLANEGYDEDDIYLHIFHDVPLRLLDRTRSKHMEYIGYTKKPREYEKVDPDSYPSAYGWNCDPEVVKLMNAAPADRGHEEQLLRSGGWRCGCGRVNASYVSSCSCGRSKIEEPIQEPAPVRLSEPVEDELQNAAAIREYKKLMDDGIITAEEFEAKKKQLLDL